MATENRSVQEEVEAIIEKIMHEDIEELKKRAAAQPKCNYTEEERKALREKEMNTEKTVHCPRCGKELEYIEYGNSYVVTCHTENCLKVTSRGI